MGRVCAYRRHSYQRDALELLRQKHIKCLQKHERVKSILFKVFLWAAMITISTLAGVFYRKLNLSRWMSQRVQTLMDESGVIELEREETEQEDQECVLEIDDADLSQIIICVQRVIKSFGLAFLLCMVFKDLMRLVIPSLVYEVSLLICTVSSLISVVLGSYKGYEWFSQPTESYTAHAEETIRSSLSTIESPVPLPSQSSTLPSVPIPGRIKSLSKMVVISQAQIDELISHERFRRVGTTSTVYMVSVDHQLLALKHWKENR